MLIRKKKKTENGLLRVNPWRDLLQTRAEKTYAQHLIGLKYISAHKIDTNLTFSLTDIVFISDFIVKKKKKRWSSSNCSGRGQENWDPDPCSDLLKFTNRLWKNLSRQLGQLSSCYSMPLFANLQPFLFPLYFLPRLTPVLSYF